MVNIELPDLVKFALLGVVSESTLSLRSSEAIVLKLEVDIFLRQESTITKRVFPKFHLWKRKI